MSNKVKLIIGVLTILIVGIIIYFGFFAGKGKNVAIDWDKFVSKYKDMTVNIKTKGDYYTNKFILKDQTLYYVSKKLDTGCVQLDKKTIGCLALNNIVKVYSVDYKETSYTYAVNKYGKLFYINNNKNSESEKYELTELGDYKKIEKIYVEEDHLVALNSDNKTFNLESKLDSYTGLKK